MKDAKGLYYFPFPGDKTIRMYVKPSGETIFFRMFCSRDPKLWDDHGWVPFEAIQAARNIYTGKQFNPDKAYDLVIARELIKDNQ